MTAKFQNPFDPRGLIFEAYRIEGIGEAECRSILLDWSLEIVDTQPVGEALASLYATYRVSDPNHPMTALLAAGLEPAQLAGRRRGRRKSPK